MWYTINNIENIDTPALVVYKDRVASNIKKAIAAIGDKALLRPHVKTNKIAEVCRMMMEEGITKFKCATIAEAEMLATIGARDILLAYQPVGRNAERLLELQLKYPFAKISCIIDNAAVAENLSTLFKEAGQIAAVFIDLNTGMNRTGVSPENSCELADRLFAMPALHVEGIHSYDGHLNQPDLLTRQQLADKAFEPVDWLRDYIHQKTSAPLTIVAGGSPTFPIHRRRGVECSPGTFVFWDMGYHQKLREEDYDFAALVITRVISIVDNKTITTDLGYKSVSSENPLPRVYFLGTEAEPVSHSEEHLVLRVPDSRLFKPGDLLYGVPVHICPTVALYDEALAVQQNKVEAMWPVVARRRKLTV